MIEKLLNYKDYNINDLEKEVIKTGEARFLFLYLFYVNTDNIEFISKKILETKDYKYIHYLLRFFEIKNYQLFLDFILLNNNDSEYIYNILYDVDYIDNDYRIKLVDKIISLNNEKYILKAMYYYFIVLNLFNDILFDRIKSYVLLNKNIKVTKDNYVKIFDLIFYNDDYEEPQGYSMNCYKGRNGYIPNIIVCHINNTFSSAIKHFYTPEDKVSSHFVIRKDGHIKQVVDLKDSAWANGTSNDEKSDAYYRFSSSEIIRNNKNNANYFSFSIEHESFDGTLSEKQFSSTIKVMKDIIKFLKEEYNYDFIIDRNHIIGHNEVNPILRKKCPGNNFPFDKIIEELNKMEDK